jgi:hypothetical protein
MVSEQGSPLMIVPAFIEKADGDRGSERNPDILAIKLIHFIRKKKHFNIGFDSQ